MKVSSGLVRPFGYEEALDSPAGWRVVGGAHAVTAVTFGSAYAFSALFPALATEFNASRGETSLIFSMAAVTYYWLGALAGPLADRFPTRAIVLVGMIALILGHIGASFAGSLPVLYASYGLGVGVGIGLSYVPAIGAVQSWFLVKRSRASGVATAGLGIGTLILPLCVGQLLPFLGWRLCLIAIACVIGLVGLPAALVLRKRGEGRGSASASGDRPGGGPSPLTAWQTPQFIRYYLAMALASVPTFVAYVHIVPSARDLGVSLEAATVLIGIIGIGNIFGRFVLAGLGDRFGRIRLLAALTLAVAGSFVIWATATGFSQLAIFAVVFGMSYGGTVGLYPAVATDLFGSRHIGSMIGYLYTSVGFAALVGPSLAGFTFDFTGSYRAPIVICIVISVVAAGLAAQLQSPQPDVSG